MTKSMGLSVFLLAFKHNGILFEPQQQRWLPAVTARRSHRRQKWFIARLNRARRVCASVRCAYHNVVEGETLGYFVHYTLSRPLTVFSVNNVTCTLNTKFFHQTFLLVILDSLPLPPPHQKKKKKYSST